MLGWTAILPAMLFELVTTVPADVLTVPTALLVLPEELSCPAVFVPLDATPEVVLQHHRMSLL